MADDQEIIARDTLRQRFENSFEDRVKRHLESRCHPISPDAYFLDASAECRDMYVTGHFYGCITLCQSVVEGLARFIAHKSQMNPPGKFEENVAVMRKRDLIPENIAKALTAVHGADRHDFHHLNKNISRDHEKLRARAKECLDGLRETEAWAFAFEIRDGDRIHPLIRKFWDVQPDNTLRVYVRFE